ncbi:hypothetical protein AMAG_11375 [Allomyces macrogynus ATCC 38327]|uniref:SET domain-containing protein n=2 Tax=Allomyces macrogynus (strain ATCC 38327) TaxID=578462 RepID=A0A0L0SWL8_ALLM3|nr:hypothetical protein AMAG_11375 [Allomyces macrogynus ATCC 38327]|eukprot:KNE66902.1 hypothetical protein AMAG_11375 [Allomyces macrogynus ATCC 38327]
MAGQPRPIAGADHGGMEQHHQQSHHGAGSVDRPEKRARLEPIDYDAEPAEADYRRLEKWILDNGGNLDNICLRKSETSEGFGVFAKSNIPAGADVAFVPNHLILSETDALASDLGRALLAYNATIPLDEYPAQHVCTKTILWLFIVHEFFNKGRASMWFPYLRALPRSYDTPLFWPERERAWLRGTNLHFVVAEKEAELQADFAAAKVVILDRFLEVWGDTSTLTFANFLWARTSCSSRAFPSDLRVVEQGRTKESKDDDVAGIGRDGVHAVIQPGPDGKYPPCKCFLALWPLFDMLNHRRGQSMMWDATRDNGIWFTTGVAMTKGEEVFNSYGPKGNDELLLSYGFCLDIPNNPDDYVPIKINFAQDPLRDRKESFLTHCNLLPFKSLFLLRYADLVPATLVACMRVLVANATELARIETGAVDVITTNVSHRNEMTVWDTLVSLLSHKCAVLEATSSDDDGDEIETALVPVEDAAAQGQFRARMALIYRSGQAQILAAALASAAQQLGASVEAASARLVRSADIADAAEFWDAAAPLIDHAAEAEWGPDEWLFAYLVWAWRAGKLPSDVDVSFAAERGNVQGRGDEDQDEDEDEALAPIFAVLAAAEPHDMGSVWNSVETDVRAVFEWMQDHSVTLMNVQTAASEDNDDDDDDEEEEEGCVNAEPLMGVVLEQ